MSPPNHEALIGGEARSSTPEPATLEMLLCAVQRRFYPATDTSAKRNFHRDRRMLLYTLSWPATWLDQRALTCTPQRYQALIAARLEAIADHGDPSRYGAYFPAYLLKCLQDWFQHHGDELYEELKHIRNALDQVLATLNFATSVRNDARQITVLATAHHLIAAERRVRAKSDTRQLTLEIE